MHHINLSIPPSVCVYENLTNLLLLLELSSMLFSGLLLALALLQEGLGDENLLGSRNGSITGQS